MRLDARASLCHAEDVRITSRDLDILHSLDRFGQLDSGHLWMLHFQGLKDTRSLEHVRKRLVAHKLIAKLGRRAVAAGGAGSGKEVYQLGPEGARILGKRGAFRPRYSAVREHSMQVGDAWAELCRAEEAGRLKVLGYLTEPDCHMKLAGVTVRPDLYVDLLLDGEQLRYFVEVDRDKENRGDIERKVRDYVAVFDNWQEVREVLDPLPRVLFLSGSDIGRHNLASYLKGRTKAQSQDWADMFLIDDPSGWADRIQ